MRSFLALVLGVGTYLGCMATGWFNGVFAAFMATIVYVFVSVFKGLVISVAVASLLDFPYTPMHAALPFLCLGIRFRVS